MCGSRLALLGLVVVMCTVPHATAPVSRPAARAPLDRTRIPRRIEPVQAAARLSGGFEANTGRFDARVDFVARRPNSTIYLSSGDAVLALRQSTQRINTPARGSSSAAGEPQDVVLRLKLAGQHQRPRIEPLEPLPARVNYFHGRDPRAWRSDIRTYSRVKYRDVYPGIDLVYYFDDTGQLEYDFIVGPGADPGAVRFRIEGTGERTIDPAGNLVIRTPDTPVIMRRPKIFQRGTPVDRTVRGRYVLSNVGEIGFAVDAYDRRQPLSIDPAFDYSTYLGGADTDEAKGLAVDAAGNVYVTGFTWSTDFPTAAAWQPSIGGTKDAFVAKFDPAGVLQYSTYIGGQTSDEGHGVAVDLAGNAYVVGSTFFSSFAAFNFPVTSGAYQTVGRDTDAFVAKFDAHGMLLASTLLGGLSLDDALAIATDTSGKPYVTGVTRSLDFPGASGIQPSFHGQEDAFLTKFNTGLSGIEYSTFLGGARVDRGQAVAVDAAGNASVAGYTESTDFPTANAIQTGLNGPNDAFVVKLNVSGSAFVFATYFGGRGAPPFLAGGGDEATALASDAAGNTIVGGFTDSPSLPVVGGFQPGIGGPANPINFGFEADGFIAVLSASGGLLYSSYLGGNGLDRVNGVAIDGGGNIFATGFTRSSNFPAAGFQPAKMADVGAYKSTDAGGQWAPITTGLTNPALTALAIDPIASNVIYAGTDNDGVFKSMNGGQSWQRSSTGLSSLYVTAVVIDPVAPSTLYAGTTGGGVSKSVDHGATWSPVNTGVLIPYVISLTIDPTSPATLYAGTLQRGAAILYKTVNGGTNWVPVFGREINAAAVDPSSSATVYAANGVLLFKSTDGGATWTQIFREPSSINHFTSLLVDPTQPSTIYAATDGSGVFKSTDGGATWNAASTGLTSRAVTSLALDRSQPATLYAGTFTAGVFKSVDGGATWVASNVGVSQIHVTQVAVDPATPSILYAAADGIQGDAFVSVVGGDGALLFSSYAGGSLTDYASGIGVGRTGRVHITGRTRSRDWPVSPAAAQPQFGRGFTDGFVSSLACVLPPTISNPSVAPAILWPPNHQMVQTAVSYTSAGGCGAVNCSLTAVSSEPANGIGDGDLEPDVRTVDAARVDLRAERSALGPGRTYTITISCTDAGGQQAHSDVVVQVPVRVQ